MKEGMLIATVDIGMMSYGQGDTACPPKGLTWMNKEGLHVLIRPPRTKSFTTTGLLSGERKHMSDAMRYRTRHFTDSPRPHLWLRLDRGRLSSVPGDCFSAPTWQVFSCPPLYRFDNILHLF